MTPGALAFTIQAGSTTSTPSQTLTITNAGGGTLTWTADDPVDWLRKNQLSGTGTGTVGAWVIPNNLSPGTYTTTITVAATGAMNSPRVIPVTLTVTAAAPPPQPTIGLSPSALSFSGTQGGSNPATQSIAVTNTGSGTLSWSVSDNASWLTAAQAGNTIVAGVNLSGLAAGTHSGTITVIATGATNTPQTIPVSLVVTAPTAQPTIALNPTSLSFTATQGGSNPTGQTIAVTNSGTGTLTWSVSDNQAWLTATQSGGSILAGVNIAGLTAGTYSGVITVAASGATNTPRTVPVSLVVTAPQAQPTIAVSPSSLSYTVPAGSTTFTANQYLTITNSGGGTLTWTAEDPVMWLQKSQLSGTGSGNVAFWVDPTGLAAGTYTTNITIAASGATNTPQVIPVTLTVTAPPAQPTIGLSPTSLAFSATTSGTNPASQSVTVTNAGTGTMTWSVTDNAGWLTATQSGNTIVASVNKSGLTAGTHSAAITVTASGATNSPRIIPVTLTLSSGTVNQSATLTWNPNGESDLAGYKVYRATASGGYGAPIATLQGNVTSFTATGLQNGTTYFFVITAYDNAGNESGWSNEVSKSIF